MSRYEDHGVVPGTELIRLSATRPDGSMFVHLYRYDTAVAFTKDFLEHEGCSDIKSERVPWDGKTWVSLDNGD